MKVYAVKVGRVSLDGYFTGYDVKAYALDAGKAEELKNRTVAALLAKADWWMDTAKNEAGEPDVEVVELGEVWE